MFTSDTDILRRAVKTALIYLLIAVFCALFGGVYERFSHGVYSYDMIYAFAYPLVGGTLPYLVIGLTGKYPHAFARMTWNCGIATLTVGSILRGVLYIYGTTNDLTILYTPVGAALLFAGAVIGFILPKHEVDRHK